MRLDLEIRALLRRHNVALAEAGHFDVLINNAGSGHLVRRKIFPKKKSQTSFKFSFSDNVQLMADCT